MATMTPPTKDPMEALLTRHQACPEAVELARGMDTWEQLWEALEAPHWMLWGLATFGYRGERRLRLFAASCALRALRRWNDPAGARAVELATAHATGAASREELLAGYAAAQKAAAGIVDRADYSEAMAHAAAAALATLREDAHDAARAASSESASAIAWDPEDASTLEDEAVWQASELRRIVGGDVHGVIAEIRKAERRSLTIL